MESCICDVSYVNDEVTIPRDHLAHKILPFRGTRYADGFKIKFILYVLLYMCQMLYTILNFVHRGKRVMSTTETKLVYNLKLNVEQRRCIYLKLSPG